MSYQKCLSCGEQFGSDRATCPSCGRGDEIRAMYGDLPGTVPEGAEGEWPDLELPGPERPQPFPIGFVPGRIGAFVVAAEQRGIPAHVAHAYAVTAIGLLAAHDYDVQLLSLQTAPPMLSFAPLTSSGGRKSTGLRFAMAGHERADDKIAARWEEAKQAAAVVDEGDGTKGPAARQGRPTALQSDATIEASIMGLAHGRQVQAVVTAEANAWYRGWSTGKGRLSASLARFNDLIDGQTVTFQRRNDATNVRVSGRRFSFCGAAQPDAALEMLASREASDGFCARVMYSESSERVPTTTDEIPPALRGLDEICRLVRERQDAGQELQNYTQPDRLLIPVNAEVRGLLLEMQAAFEEQADRAVAAEDPWSAAFYSRGTENVIRLAAVYDVADAYGESPADEAPAVWLQPDFLRNAYQLIIWYASELKRLVERGRRTRLAERFDRLQRITRDATSEAELRNLRVYREGSGWACNWSRLADRLKLHDPLERKQALELLVHQEWLRPGGSRGRFLVNPALIRVK